jgi:putative transposase
MTYDRRKHHRRSIRLKDYDYAQRGAYFVTICTQDGEPLLGEIVSGRMCLNAAGEMVWGWWQRLNDKYPSVYTDATIVMPNHVHGIIVIAGDPEPGQPHRAAPTRVALNTPVGATPRGRPDTDTTVGTTQPGHPQGGHPDPNADDPPPTLGQIVGWFKTMTTNEYIRGVKQQGWPPFPGKVWQRNYYEHVIRKGEALERIRAYIQANPQRWALDRENPQRQGLDELESWIYDPPGSKAG